MNARRFLVVVVLLAGCDVGPVEREDPVDLAAPDDLDFDTPPDAMPDCSGSIGCECLDGDVCAIGLECMAGMCGPCPAGNPGCACEAGNVCDIGLECVSNVCEWAD